MRLLSLLPKEKPEADFCNLAAPLHLIGDGHAAAHPFRPLFARRRARCLPSSPHLVRRSPILIS